MSKKDEKNVLWITLFVFLILFVVALGLLTGLVSCDIINIGAGSDDDDSGDSNDTNDYDNNDDSGDDNPPYGSDSICTGLIPPSTGDIGGYCDEQGSCDTDRVCDNYWYYAIQEHRCACTNTYFCALYCYDYIISNNCECPPNSERVVPGDNWFWCEPIGYDCDSNGNVIPE